MNSAESASDATHQRSACFNGYRLESVFQPIFSLSHRRTIGSEALVRAKDSGDVSVSPLELFASASDQTQLLQLDASCQALHIRNFACAAPACRWLFLNLDPATITQKTYRDGMLADALAAAELSPHSLVVEILEAGIDDESLLIEAVAYFRALGAHVALDDFGAGYSNFDRIWRLAPDIIKLDRSLIVEAQQHHAGRLRRILPNLVSLMHEAGCLVLAEGIETDEQALVAIDADVDFVQGFYFAHPQPTIEHDLPAVTRCLESLTTRFAKATVIRDQAQRRDLAPYVDVFRAVADAIESGHAIERTCQSLLRMPRTARCYLLNEWGEELVHYPGAPQNSRHTRQAGPLSDTGDGTWFRRHYFREAVGEPRRHKISRPYLSSAGTEMCITLSIANDEIPCRVFCCDIYC